MRQSSRNGFRLDPLPPKLNNGANRRTRAFYYWLTPEDLVVGYYVAVQSCVRHRCLLSNSNSYYNRVRDLPQSNTCAKPGSSLFVRHMQLFLNSQILHISEPSSEQRRL